MRRTVLRTLIVLAALACLGTVAASARTRHHSGTHAKKVSKHSRRHHGQQAIQEERAREIQTALIREHYLDGEPTGVWDQRTQSAMARYQADNGWQSRVLPDARALIKLGLGPKNDGLLNPETAAAPTVPTPLSPGTVERKMSTGSPQHK